MDMKNNCLRLGRLALVLACLMFAVSDAAATRFFINNVNATPGKVLELPIFLEGDVNITAFQLDVLIPNGFEVVNHVFTDQLRSGARTDAAMVDGFYRVIGYQYDGGSLLKKMGTFKMVTLYIQVPEEASGAYACSMDKVIIVLQGNNESIRPNEVPFIITCPTSKPAGVLKTGDTFAESGIYYRVTSPKTVEVTYHNTDYNSYRGTVTIPPTVTYGDVTYTVEAIGSKAFYRCSSLKKVELPNTIKAIKAEAFLGCNELAEINLPEGLTRLDTYSFAGYSKLTSLVIPSTLTSIGYAVFTSIPNLRHIEVAKGNPVFDSRGDCNAIIKTETNELVKGGLNTVIPDGVEIIGENAFQGCPITSIDIPMSVRKIDYQAFVGSGLKSVFIPEYVNEVGPFAFCNCEDLESVTIAGGALLDFGAFMGASAVKRVTALAPLAKMKNINCFDDVVYRDATLYTIYKDMSHYDGYEDWKHFKNICLKCYDYYVNGIYYMRDGANSLWVTFKDENYNSYRGTQLRIPSNVYIDGKDFRVTEIRDKAFYNCSNLKHVTLPDKNLYRIQSSAFGNCTSLQEIRIAEHNHDFYIWGGAFSGCTNLKKVYLSSECTFPFEYNIFSRCDNISWVVSKSMTPPKMNTSIFTKATYDKATLYVNKKAVTAYKQDPSWGEFKKIVGLTDEELQQRYDAMTEVEDSNGTGIVDPADETCEYEEQYEGSEPLTKAQVTNDHLFVRQEGEADDMVTLKGDKTTVVEVWLDDDEIYTNQKLQNLVSVARTGEGDYYKEVTYSALSFDLYLPMNVEFDNDQLIKGDRMPVYSYLAAGTMVGTKEIKGKTYKIYRVVAIRLNSIEGAHFSAQTISDYRANGALKKDDGYLLGLRLRNTDPDVAKPGDDDFIIANVEFVINEAFMMGWPEQDRRYFYANGFADHQGQKGGICCLYHRVKLNYK